MRIVRDGERERGVEVLLLAKGREINFFLGRALSDPHIYLFRSPWCGRLLTIGNQILFFFVERRGGVSNGIELHIKLKIKITIDFYERTTK